MRNALFTILCCLVCALPAGAQGETLLLRFPTIHDGRIVFGYAGNLYTVAAKGGTARRLTSHEGYEMFPRFSPDGKTIAFTGQYDGNTEVYSMPSDGGIPKRLTYTATLSRDDVSDRMGPNNIVMGWKNDGREILFRSRMASFNDFVGQLYTVPADGGPPEALSLPRGGFASYAPDDSKIAFNRVFREFRTWKRYRGGMADDVWIYDFKTKKTERITETDAQDIFPMWAGTKIYYISDRDESKRFNLFAYDTATKETRQLTHFKDFDIKFPSLGDRAIVFELGGAIYRMDLDGEKAEKVTVRILEDMNSGRGGLRNVSKEITSFGIAPDGRRALFGARGEVFSVPAGQGVTRNLTNTSGVHERDAVWAPDGKTVAYVSDASGETEIYTLGQDGSDSPKRITTGGDTYKYGIKFSPDSKKIAWTDKKNRLQFVDLETKKATVAAQAKAFEIRDFAWSPDGKWIAYSQPETDVLQKVYLYSLEKGTSAEVTDGWYASYDPCFSSDGKWLFFVSNRDFNPIYSATEWNHAYQDMARIYFVALAKDAESPFKPKSDEVNAAPPAAKPAEPLNVKVDLEGLKDRTLSLPVPPGNYSGLESAGGLLYYSANPYRQPGSFRAYDLAANKELNLGPAAGFATSADGKKMIVSRNGQYGIVDLPKAPFEFKPLDLAGMEMKLDRHAEWKQIYDECWRQMRDFFYDPGLHGTDWPAVKEKYGALLPHVQHRYDLTYLIGEMISELNAGHCYVGGGDAPKVEKVPMGLIGAKLKLHPDSRYVRVEKILKGANWDKALRSPLTELGAEVKEGEFIVAVNGVPVNEVKNIQELLVNTAGKPVQLRVNGEPNSKGARTVTVTPIGDERELYYYDWVQGNIKKVNDATGGAVGYLHVPDMSAVGLNEFIKHFYPQLGKKALIVDVRGNGGGNASPMLIERLRREIAMVGIARNGAPTVSPVGTFLGPMCCLLNEFSASDGDLFPFQFKHYKLGPLIGKRSWGGVVGIRGSLPLLDGGTLSKPEFSRYDIGGKEWVIEGRGVDPDIVQDNDPAKEYAGTDEQLNRGIAEMLEKLKKEGKALPPVPVYPKR